MNAAVKYALGRIGLFVLVAAPLLFLLPAVNIFIRLMVAVVVSAVLSFFLLRNVRDELTRQMEASMLRRRAEKERLRARLAGEDVPAQPEETRG